MVWLQRLEVVDGMVAIVHSKPVQKGGSEVACPVVVLRGILTQAQALLLNIAAIMLKHVDLSSKGNARTNAAFILAQ
jgi:hypothetical protein